MTVLLVDIKTSIGILEENLGFDSELLMFINSAASSLVQLGVVEMDIPIEEETEWPIFPNDQVKSLVKHFVSLKVRQTFDPVASETISKTISSSVIELEGRIAHEMAEVLDAG